MTDERLFQQLSSMLVAEKDANALKDNQIKNLMEELHLIRIQMEEKDRQHQELLQKLLDSQKEIKELMDKVFSWSRSVSASSMSAADAKVLERYHRKKVFARNSERSKMLNHNGFECPCFGKR